MTAFQRQAVYSTGWEMLRQQLNCVLGLLIISACASRVSAGPIAGASIAGEPDLQICALAMLLADDGAASDAFGFSVSVSDDVAVVSASGSAYVFRRNGTLFPWRIGPISVCRLLIIHGNRVLCFPMNATGKSAIIGVR